jgi:hypothetical protein
MSDQRQQSELDYLLLQAKTEIQSLRRANEVLSAKVQVMDLFAATLFGHPMQHSVGMGEDIAWKIEQYFNRRAEQAKRSANTDVGSESATQDSGSVADPE